MWFVAGHARAYILPSHWTMVKRINIRGGKKAKAERTAGRVRYDLADALRIASRAKRKVQAYAAW